MCERMLGSESALKSVRVHNLRDENLFKTYFLINRAFALVFVPFDVRIVNFVFMKLA